VSEHAGAERRPGVARPGSRVLGAARTALLGLGLAVLALGLGLLAAYLVSLVRGSGEPGTGMTHPPTAGPTPDAASRAPAAPEPVAVPLDWTPALVSRLGVTVRHPPAWSRYTQARLTVWVATTRTGGRGIDEVGIGRLDAAPATSALDQFARSFFAGSPDLKIAAATGDEQQADLALTYIRTGARVRVALHGERGPRGVTATLARTPATPKDTAAKLLAEFRAGITTTP
jgi:hypothetical protein